MNRTILIILLLFACAVFGCKEEETPPAPIVTNVTIEPSVTSVAKGGERQFSATVTGKNNPKTNVTWSIEGTVKEKTSINSSGLLKIADDESAASFKVAATSTVKPFLKAEAEVTVTNNSCPECGYDCPDCGGVSCTHEHIRVNEAVILKDGDDVTDTEIELFTGNNITLTAELLPSDSEDIEAITFRWTISGNAVAFSGAVNTSSVVVRPQEREKPL